MFCEPYKVTVLHMAVSTVALHYNFRILVAFNEFSKKEKALVSVKSNENAKSHDMKFLNYDN